MPPLATVPLPCTLCGDVPARSLPYAYLYGGAEFRGVACSRCHLVRVGTRPADLAALYRAEYFDADYRCGHAERGACEGGGAPLVDSEILDLLARFAPGRRLLEVGPAGGDFLRGAASRGWTVMGIEISEAAARAARENFGLDVRAGELTTAGFPAASVDAIYMGDVLEHAPDPMASLREAHRVLVPGGALVIAGPTTICSLARRLGLAAYAAAGRVRYLRTPPYHLWEFTPPTLTRLVEQAGFRVGSRRASKIPPSTAGRCSRVVDSAAVLPLEWFNVWVTALTGCCGDRLVLVATSADTR